jgi:hypothetical protein
VHDDEADSFEDDPLHFQVATLNGGYYYLDSKILPIGVPLLIHQTAPINWKWFTAEQRVSIFKEIAELRPRRIVIGGDAPDAIPTAEYEKLIENFPTRHDLKRYVLARVGSVIREYSDTQVDAEHFYRAYVAKNAARSRCVLSRSRAAEISILGGSTPGRNADHIALKPKVHKSDRERSY